MALPTAQLAVEAATKSPTTRASPLHKHDWPRQACLRGARLLQGEPLRPARPAAASGHAPTEAEFEAYAAAQQAGRPWSVRKVRRQAWSWGPHLHSMVPACTHMCKLTYGSPVAPTVSPDCLSHVQTALRRWPSCTGSGIWWASGSRRSPGADGGLYVTSLLAAAGFWMASLCMEWAEEFASVL